MNGDRHAPLNVSPEAFRSAGHTLVDRLADFLASIPERPLTTAPSPAQVQARLGQGPLPQTGQDLDTLLGSTFDFVTENSLLNGHPRFFGYITSSPSPAGALADLLAATVNPNCGGFELSPAATEIERQAVQWMAELVGFPAGPGAGILSSGGNMANFIAFLAARRAQTGEEIRREGLAGRSTLRVYVSGQTHTWIEKAADLFGHGTDAIRWIDTDKQGRMDVAALELAIDADAAAGDTPFMVVGTAGTVGTGTIDPLAALSQVCRSRKLWFHVDGAYGAFAAALAEADDDLKALGLADSVALDPHKWLYAPLEAGCTLVRDAEHLRDAFKYRPSYYGFEAADEPTNFFEMGPQNSRGFRALKVWMGLSLVGRQGYETMIRDDIKMARLMFEAAREHPELQAFTCELSIATFRFVPPGLEEEELNELNQLLLKRIQAGGQAYLSNAVLDGHYVLRACVVNFRTQPSDARALIDLVVEEGRRLMTETR